MSLSLGCGVLAAFPARSLLSEEQAASSNHPSPPWRMRGNTHRDPANLLNMDHVLVQTDLVGEFRVERVTLSDDGHSVLVEVSPLDVWFNRNPNQERLTLGVESDAWGDFRHILVEGQRIVAFVSGGSWTRSTFTYDEKSIFAVAEDGRILCGSGNPLFAVSNNGFTCSIQEYMPTSPLTVAEMKQQMHGARSRAVNRLPELAARLDAERRPLTTRPYVPPRAP